VGLIRPDRQDGDGLRRLALRVLRRDVVVHHGAERGGELFEIPYDKGSQPLREYGVTRDGRPFVTGYAGRDWRQVNVALG
jgi:hypothetical protein